MGKITLYMYVAMAAYALLVLGIKFRKNKHLHVGLMSLGMAIDLSLVLILEFQRGVVEGLPSQSFNIWQWSHVGVSTLAVLFYIPTFIYGFKIMKNGGPPELRQKHIKCGIIAFVLRTLGLILMFSMTK